MEVEIHDLTSPRVDFGDFRNHGFSRTTAATAAANGSTPMESEDAGSPPTTGPPELISGDMDVEFLDSMAPRPRKRIPTTPTNSTATASTNATPTSTPMHSAHITSPPSNEPIEVATGDRMAEIHDLGSPLAANGDFRQLQPSPEDVVSTADRRRPAQAPATLPVRAVDPGSHGDSQPRVQPRPRGSAASATSATPAHPSPPTDPWAAFASTRVQAAKASRAKDVGIHRPSMVDLGPLLAKHAAGTLAFHDTMPIQKHDKREVIGWLHMATGNHTKAINEDAAMASLLHDNQSLVKGDTLVDVIKCEKDLQNRMLRWGVASDTALRQLQGTTLKLRITTTSGKVKSTTLVSFQLTLPHALDGFYMDIPAGLQCLFEERLLFETLHRLEPRFLWGMYTSVSATTGLAGSRYRLHFLGSEIPSTMLLDGRMVEEFIFRGRCVRVYGRGWFFRDKRLARLDLDSITASKAPVIPSTPPPPPTTAPQATPAKRQKTTTKDPSEWTEVRRKTPSVQPAPNRVHTHGRPWTSPNAFAALHERWHVGHAVHQANHDGVGFESIIPELHTLDNDHVHLTTDEYVTCPKPTKGKVSHLEVPVDELLSELQSLEAKSIAAVQHLASHVEDAVRGSEFNLANLVDSGRVDSICTMMARHPEDFGIQLHHLFAADRPTFELLIRQRLLHRWLRATWGGSASFDQLYTKSFGHKMTRASMLELFRALQQSDYLAPIVSETDDGDELTLSRFDLELVLALAEVLAAAHSPLYFGSDAAIMVSTECTMEIIPTHRGVRSLTAPTMLNVLMSTHVGEELWRIMDTMFAGDDDMHRVMVNLYDIHESGFINLPSIGITRWDQELGRFVVPTDEIEDPAIPADDSTMTPVVNRQY
ncbi:hypothetical protein B5M09_011371 [Aphanomyces astaci]|uniref:Uncharacterized protein n=1 Tax=Aphanomyces astaci TaxID=112090 RepID=A0A425CYC7_APHAT|nr:hypothetical protein B5M09_011371 [Aphanomyces astaci]